MTMNMKLATLIVTAATLTTVGAAPYEHVIVDRQSLDGAWEMAYQPYEWETFFCPDFQGKLVKDAVPGYWEDMVPAFRAAGIKDEFRINPLYRPVIYPIGGYASDLTLPNIRGCFFYRRTVELKNASDIYLSFEGVRNQVHVWVNGKFAAFRQGFSTPFELKIQRKLLNAGKNEIILAVSNNPIRGFNGAPVCGLTTRAVFGATGGVNGHLEIRVPRNELSDVYVTTAQDLETFTIHTSGGVKFEYVVRDGERTVLSGTGQDEVTLSTEDFTFWSPENPKRYELVLKTPEGEYRQLFGIRRLTTKDAKFRLNGEPVYLRGITEHCYFAKTVHLPRDLDYYRMITAKRKELGFNFVRFHTFVPPEEYFEATDELGMLVHLESPNFTDETEFAQIVAFARRHPSVVIYCCGNEWRIDRLAEAYLENVARIIHTGSDALFSPMSALRGIEYALMDGLDVKKREPFPHNPERLQRVAKFCDMFTSYQQGEVSYLSLRDIDTEKLDGFAEVYQGKPITSHEICIDGSYVDLGLGELYPKDSPILKTGVLSGIVKQLKARGLIDRADIYFRHSCEWMRRIRKRCFEKLRKADRTSGYDFLGDINTHWHTSGYSVGMMDEFYRLKPGETVKNVLRYNSAAVVLCDLDSDFNFSAGDTRKVSFQISNYAAEAEDATLKVELLDGARAVVSETLDVGDVDNGTLSDLGSVTLAFPKTAAPKKYILRATFASDRVKAENEWELYAFPRVEMPAPAEGLTVCTQMDKDELLARLDLGENILLLGAKPFNFEKTTFRIGMAGRTAGNFATVIQSKHPVFRDWPQDGYCDWAFRRLLENGKAAQLEAGVPFDPIVDIASSIKFIIRQAMMFEYRVGAGKLLVCSFNFEKDDPAANWLKARLIDYASSDEFKPQQALTLAQLKAVLEAPHLSGAVDFNRATNKNDPSDAARAHELAQP